MAGVTRRTVVSAIIAAGGAACVSAPIGRSSSWNSVDGTHARAEHRAVRAPSASRRRSSSRCPARSCSRGRADVRAGDGHRSAASRAARGGRTRWRTRWRASRADADVIVIHDAARPFVSAALIDRDHRAPRRARRGDRRAARARHGQAGRRRADRSVAADRRDAAARDDLPGADAAGLPARRAARALDDGRELGARASPTKRCSPSAPACPCTWSSGDPANIKITTAEDLDGRAGTAAYESRRAARSAPATTCTASSRDVPSSWAASRIPFERGPRRPLRRRHRLPRGDRRGARRGGRRRHRAPVPGHRSAVEGRRQPRRCWRGAVAHLRRAGYRGVERRRHGDRRSGRSCCRTSRRCGRTSPRALEVEVGQPSASRARPTSRWTAWAAASRWPAMRSRWW